MKITIKKLSLFLIFTVAISFSSMEKFQFNKHTDNFFTVNTAYAQKLSRKDKVYLGGTPVGIKLNSKGLLIIALSDIEGANDTIYTPSIESDLRIGDIILEVEGTPIYKGEDLTAILNKLRKEVVEIKFLRNDDEMVKEVKVAIDKDGAYKMGVWVRSSMTGIGTLTYFNDENKTFGALGHAVTDSDTDDIFKIEGGDLVESSISSVVKGKKGTPGELRGIFINEKDSIGDIKINSSLGIFGSSDIDSINIDESRLISVAKTEEIKEGAAKIYTTVEGEEPSFYDINIQKLNDQNTPSTKSMVIVVTDEALLNKTGGIVQGMSGSPIIQNNKLIGAVTHVLVNKPNTGYGIYIDWMLKECENIS